MGDKLLLWEKGESSANHIFTSSIVLEYIYLYLVLSFFLIEDLKKANSYSALFEYLHKIVKKIKLDYVCTLLEYNKKYISQEKIPLKKLQYLFLALIYKLHILSILRSLKSNKTIAFRDPIKILKTYKLFLKNFWEITYYHAQSQSWKLKGYITTK